MSEAIFSLSCSRWSYLIGSLAGALVCMGDVEGGWTVTIVFDWPSGDPDTAGCLREVGDRGVSSFSVADWLTVGMLLLF